MKKIIMIAATALALAACENAATDDGNVEEKVPTKKFTFTVKGDFLNPEFTEGSRANAYMTADGAEMTDLWVIDAVPGDAAQGLIIKQQLHQDNNSPEWGSPQMSLSLGTHHILFLASRGTEPRYNNGTVTWTKPLDTFFTDYEVTVTKTSNGNRAVTLSRCATKLTISVADAIADGTTAVSLAPAKWYNGFNMLTAEPVLADSYSVSFPLTSAYAGLKNTSFSIWGLSAAEEWTTDVTITSKAGETTNASVTIADAPFKANRTTRYTGNLYTNTSASSLSLDATWLQQYEGVY